MRGQLTKPDAAASFRKGISESSQAFPGTLRDVFSEDRKFMLRYVLPPKRMGTAEEPTIHSDNTHVGNEIKPFLGRTDKTFVIKVSLGLCLLGFYSLC